MVGILLADHYIGAITKPSRIKASKQENGRNFASSVACSFPITSGSFQSMQLMAWWQSAVQLMNLS